MLVFKATEPRDAIHALLALARDAYPHAKSNTRDRSSLIMSLFDDLLEEKPFPVDYSRPCSDVCRDFVEFSIRRKAKLDPVRALDIVFRPWALESQGGSSIHLGLKGDIISYQTQTQSPSPSGRANGKRDYSGNVEVKRRSIYRQSERKFRYVWETAWKAEKQVEDPV
jgi:hypothetical protein